MNDVRKWLEGIENHSKYHYSDWYPDDVIRVLRRLFNEAEDQDEGMQNKMGKLKMLTVLMKLENNDLSCLPLKDFRDDQKTAFVTQFELDLRSSYVGLLVGKSGRHLKPLSDKYNVKISILTKQLTLSSTVTVEITSPSCESLQSLVNELKLLAKSIREKRETHKRTVGEWIRKRNVRSLQGRCVTMDVSSDEKAVKPEELKEKARARFEMKKLKSSLPKRKAIPVLEKGHCMHCMTPFHKGPNKVGDCQFHSGFPKNGYWSCCGLVSDGRDFCGMHTATGCTQGRHIWRPGPGIKTKKGGSKRGAGQKKSYLGCFYSD
jgi:hypothetical protein